MNNIVVNMITSFVAGMKPGRGFRATWTTSEDQSEIFIVNRAFRHVYTLFVQGNQVRTDQNKPQKETNKTKVCFDQYELDYLGQIKFLHKVSIKLPYILSNVVLTLPF